LQTKQWFIPAFFLPYSLGSQLFECVNARLRSDQHADERRRYRWVLRSREVQGTALEQIVPVL
jgi:hypothetical protein